MENKQKALAIKIKKLHTLFNELKKQIDVEQFQDEFKQIIENFENIIGENLDIEENIISLFPDEIIDSISEMVESVTKEIEHNIEGIEKDNLQSQDRKKIQEIDFKLAQKNISEEDINNLLDKRSQLI